VLISNVSPAAVSLADLGINGFTLEPYSGVVDLSKKFTRSEILNSVQLKTALRIGFLVNPSGKTRLPTFAGSEKLFLPTDKIQVLINRKMGGLGDNLTIFPVVHEIKKRFENSFIEVNTGVDYYGGALVDIWKHNKDVDKVSVNDKTSLSEYNFVLNMQCPANRYEVKNMKTYTVNKNRIQLFLEAAGLYEGNSVLPIYTVSTEEKEKVHPLIKQFTAPIVGIVLRTQSKTRSWNMSKYEALIKQLLALHYNIIVFDHVKTKAFDIRSPQIVYTNNFVFNDSVALLSFCNYVITPDTGLMHFAGAFNIPMVTMFGNTDPLCRINWYNNVLVIQKKNQFKQCMPCWYIYSEKECIYPKNEVSVCMEAIQVWEVVETFKQLVLDKGMVRNERPCNCKKKIKI